MQFDEVITAQELQQLMAEHKPFVLLDVRDPQEYAICNLGGQLIPMTDLPHSLTALDKKQHYVVHCKAGIRSEKAAEIMRAAGFTSVQCLQGGILAWIKDVNPDMPSY